MLALVVRSPTVVDFAEASVRQDRSRGRLPSRSHRGFRHEFLLRFRDFRTVHLASVLAGNDLALAAWYIAPVGVRPVFAARVTYLLCENILHHRQSLAASESVHWQLSAAYCAENRFVLVPAGADPVFAARCVVGLSVPRILYMQVRWEQIHFGTYRKITRRLPQALSPL